MTLHTKIELHFQFELDIYYGYPGDKENAMIIHFKDNSKQLLDTGKLMYKNIQKEMRRNIQHLEDLNYCKVNDVDIEFDNWDITVTLDVDINENELGAYGENGIIFFVRKAIPELRTYPTYDVIIDDEAVIDDGIVAPYLACVRIISVDK